jgi:hypothetical protein
MSDMPYAWAPFLLAAAFVIGCTVSAVRFVNSGGAPRHAVGLAVNAVLALITGWVAWLAWFGPPLP